MIKTYVLDTNILMATEGRAIMGFDDNNIAITDVTLEELDKHKTAPGEKGFQAREAIRAINTLIDQYSDGHMSYDGAKLPSGGKLMFVNLSNKEDDIEKLPTTWDLSKPDNVIIETCLQLGKNSHTILVTNDTCMKLKAMNVGVEVQDYKNEQITEEPEIKGRSEIFISEDLLDTLHDEKSVSMDNEELCDFNFYANEYIIAHSSTSKNGLLTRYDQQTNSLKYINGDKTAFGITPKNAAQRFALDALLAPADEIPLVILRGCAGTGKTILSMAAGLNGTYDSKKNRRYDSVVITRSNTLSDEDLGFLPGSLEDKMTPLLAPFFDNAKFLIGKNIEDRDQVNKQVDDMLYTGVIEITSLSYIRGRSLNNTFLIVDESQNLTRLQAKTIVTRMGQGSKLVILGDPNQIDNPKLDKKNNGLVYLSEKFKNCPLCAQVEFLDSESVRSPLAKEAIQRLG